MFGDLILKGAPVLSGGDDAMVTRVIVPIEKHVPANTGIPLLLGHSDIDEIAEAVDVQVIPPRKA